MSAFWEALVP